MSDIHSSLLDRLISNSKKTGTCIEWQRSIHSAGYGQIWSGPRNLSTHRIAYELFVGIIPDGMLVLHECDNRRCIRPQHLFLGTDQNNAEDKITKGRHGNRRGPKQKLDDAAVAEIRRRCDYGETQRSVASHFRIGVRYLQRILSGERR